MGKFIIYMYNKVMNYKCIFCDLDETLLDNNKNIHIDNVNSIKSLKEKNIKFVCSTGRHFYGITKILKTLDLYDQENEYIISLNGALIVECKNHRILYSSTFSGLKAIEIVKFACKHNLCVELYTPSNIYIYNLNEDERERVNKSGLNFIEIDDWNLDYLVHEDVLKIALESSDYSFILSLKDEAESIIDENIHFSYSSNRYMEFNSSNADKGIALHWLANYLNIEIDETIAIGDHLNDLSMLRAAGLSVAVSNAQDEIKKICDVITEKNNNEGAIAEVIHKYIGGNYE